MGRAGGTERAGRTEREGRAGRTERAMHVEAKRRKRDVRPKKTKELSSDIEGVHFAPHALRIHSNMYK